MKDWNQNLTVFMFYSNSHQEQHTYYNRLKFGNRGTTAVFVSVQKTAVRHKQTPGSYIKGEKTWNESAGEDSALWLEKHHLSWSLANTEQFNQPFLSRFLIFTHSLCNVYFAHLKGYKWKWSLIHWRSRLCGVVLWGTEEDLDPVLQEFYYCQIF